MTKIDIDFMHLPPWRRRLHIAISIFLARLLGADVRIAVVKKNAKEERKCRSIAEHLAETWPHQPAAWRRDTDV